MKAEYFSRTPINGSHTPEYWGQIPQHVQRPLLRLSQCGPRVLHTEDAIREVLPLLHSGFSIDLESPPRGGEIEPRVSALAIASDYGVFVLPKMDQPKLEILREVLADRRIPKYGFDLRFDLYLLKEAHIVPRGFLDVQERIPYLVPSKDRNVGLCDAVSLLLGGEHGKDLQKSGFNGDLTSDQVEYLAGDALWTYLLHLQTTHLLKLTGRDAWMREDEKTKNKRGRSVRPTSTEKKVEDSPKLIDHQLKERDREVNRIAKLMSWSFDVLSNRHSVSLSLLAPKKVCRKVACALLSNRDLRTSIDGWRLQLCDEDFWQEVEGARSYLLGAMSA